MARIDIDNPQDVRASSVAHDRSGIRSDTGIARIPLCVDTPP